MMKVNEIREDFPITKEWVFLANCGTSPMPQPVAEAIHKKIEDRMHRHSISKEAKDYCEGFNEGRVEAARLIGAKKDEIAFIRNTTEGICIAASMIDWEPGDNVIITDLNFPSNVIPWKKQEKYHKIETRCVKCVDDRILLSDIEKRINEHTRVIAIDHVIASNGFKFDLEQLGRICDDHNIYLFVDAIQSMGSVAIDVKKMKVDILAAGGHKRLHAPTGIGILYVKEDLIERFEPAYVGVWQTDKISFLYQDAIPELARNARRFEFGGEPNELGYAGLVAACKYLNGLGIENIERRIRELMDCLISQLDDYMLPMWGKAKKHRSAHIGLRTLKNPRRIYKDCLEEKVFLAPYESSIGEWLRIAPSFYNTKKEVEKCVKLLKRLEFS